MMMAASVCLSLAAQIAENIDYIRFMPPKTPENSTKWWASVIMAGPGWVVFGVAKQIMGVFLAVYVMSYLGGSEANATEPVHQFFAMYQSMMPRWLAVALAVILVVMSQIKINVTNAYSGSLAWTNAYSRMSKRHISRTAFVFLNVGISLALMEYNMFSVLSTVLGFYSNVAIAWIFIVAADIAINKSLLKISPVYPEFRRGMIPNFNPVGIGSLALSAAISLAMYFGAFGSLFTAYSAMAAAIIAVVATPLIALATKGKYYRRRTHDGIEEPLFDEHGNPSNTIYTCCVAGEEVERPDVIASAVAGPDGEKRYISSLALSLDKGGDHVLPADLKPRG